MASNETNPLLPHFERIDRRIIALWGTKDCRNYLNSLLTDTRNDTRSGFPPVIAKELFRLLHNHDLEFPQFSNATDIVVPFTTPTRRRADIQPGIDLFKVLRLLVMCGLGAVALKQYLL